MPDTLPITTGKDGKQYYDLGPGLKPRPVPETPAGSGAMSARDRITTQWPNSPGMPGYDPHADTSGAPNPATFTEGLHRDTENPQLIAGLIGAMTGGAGLVGPPIVAGASSLVHHLTDPAHTSADSISDVGSAGLNAAAAMLPGLTGKVMEGGPAARTMIGAAAGIKGKIPAMIKALHDVLAGTASEAAPAITKGAATVAGDVGQYATHEGQTALVQAMVDLENRLQSATGPARALMQKQLGVLEDLNTRAVGQMKNALPALDDVLSKTGLGPIVTQAQTQAKAAATKVAQQRDTIVNALRVALGIGQASGAGSSP